MKGSEMPETQHGITRWKELAYKMDRGIGSRAHIGMVVISNDQTLSAEARAMLNVPGIALYESRLPTTRKRNEPVSAKNLGDQAAEIEKAVQQINTLIPSDVVALGCTSAAMVIGREELERRVKEVHPGALVTDPFSAILAALESVGAKNIAYVSPYPQNLAEQMIAGIEANGYSVLVAGTFKNEVGFIGDEAPFISPESIAHSVKTILLDTCASEVDTVIVACTQMRAASVIRSLETETGKTIITSNQALCWHALRLAGCSDQIKGWGRLFTV